MNAAISAAITVVGKALAPVSDGLLESWAASNSLGTNISALGEKLLHAQAMLYTAQDRDITNPALNEQLLVLRGRADGAKQVLDELDYFRIQDGLDNTYHAADKHPGGCMCGLGLNARHTAKDVANKFKFSLCSHDASSSDPDDQDNSKQGCLSVVGTCGQRRVISSSPPSPNDECVVTGGCMPKVASSARGAAHAVGKQFMCCFLPSVQDDAHTGIPESSKAPRKDTIVQTSKLMFDRVEMSKRMATIVQQLDAICADVKAILDLELHKPTQGIAGNRPKTTLTIIEPQLFGRDAEKKSIIDGISTNGQYCANGLAVLPIVGPGGIGKTAFTQHICQEVKSSFDVIIWICVSLSFSAERLSKEIVKRIPEVVGEKQNGLPEELIEQRLKNKRFLLVLDDVWTYHEDEWNKLLAPFRKGEARGDVVIVTTRIPHVATAVKTVDRPVVLKPLGSEDFMHLFEAYVFDHQQPWKDHTELLDVGRKIVANLKGFPLAAKTVGRLLRKHLTLDHWRRVLESKEWELQTNDNDIMPALKLSYDFLPFPLQRCFSYCALFAEDYEFESEELVHLWIGLDILDSCNQRKRLEDVGLCYLDDLTNHGFFKKNEKDGSACYSIHDLLHELAVNVSSSECLSISSSNVRSEIAPSVRHLSIIIDEKDVNDRMTFEHLKRDLSTLAERLKVENLQTLMLFGEYHGSFVKTFGDLFAEAKALRVIFLSEASYIVEEVFWSLPKFVHLRYLRITPLFYAKVSLNIDISRFYQLRVLDVQRCNVQFGFRREMSNLAKLRHFIVPDNELHSGIFEVGKLKCLQELRSFMVRKENKGFELSQIGQLVELGGSLEIRNIENVEQEEEANEAKLIQKIHLKNLVLEWGTDQPNKDPVKEEHVLERLKPHSNLLDLCIKGNGGSACPSWLGENLSAKNLESLCLNDVAWKKLPPIGELWFVGELGEEHQSCISSQCFQNLKRLELVKIPRLRKWSANGTCQFFSQLEVLIVRDCCELLELPFLGCQSEQEANMTLFPRLRKLEIIDCPKLSALPPVPWTPALCSARIERSGSGFKELCYSKRSKSESSLIVVGKEGVHDSLFWNVLAFSNLADLKVLTMNSCPPLPLDHLQKLTCLKSLHIESSSNVLLPTDVESDAIYQLPIKTLTIWDCGASGKEVTQLLSHFPNLSYLAIYHCEKITRVGVVQQQETTRPASSSANKKEQAQIGQQQQQTREDEEIAAGDGLLLLPPQLQALRIWKFPEVTLLSSSPNDGAQGGGLQGLRSLRKLCIERSPKILSNYSSSLCFPFPASLQKLDLYDIEGMEALEPLSNLASLTELKIWECGDLRGEGIWPLLAQGSLTELHIHQTPKFFASLESSRPHDQEPRSCKLEVLETDDPTGFLTAPLLSSSLTRFCFSFNEEVECFTKEQEDALQLLTSLQVLEFHRLEKLQCLPEGLHRISSLKTLKISYCRDFESLPKCSLPSSLQNLRIDSCPAFKSLPKDSLPSSLQYLKIVSCPALKSLPKDGLPILRELDVHYGNSEELVRQCRKLKGTIPIIRDSDF